MFWNIHPSFGNMLGQVQQDLCYEISVLSEGDYFQTCSNVY